MFKPIYKLLQEGERLKIPGVYPSQRKYNRSNKQELVNIIERWKRMDELEQNLRRSSLKSLKQFAIQECGLYGVGHLTNAEKEMLIQAILDTM